MVDLQQTINELNVQIDNIFRFNASQRVVCALKKQTVRVGGSDNYSFGAYIPD